LKVSVRLTESEEAKLNQLYDHYGVSGKTETDRFKELLKDCSEQTKSNIIAYLMFLGLDVSKKIN
jgi:plasmid stabilization system protein ParE